jgi:phosphatidate cytidylyltransferase
MHKNNIVMTTNNYNFFFNSISGIPSFIDLALTSYTSRSQSISLSASSALSASSSSSSSSSPASREIVGKVINDKKLIKRWATGLSLGALGTIWILSGNEWFTLGFLITSLIAQYEYYSMVEATGVKPAKKIGILTSLICYVVASMCPQFHELVMPLAVTMLMLWLLIFKKTSSTIGEISTSLLGMFYIGYLPSFWVRLRSLNSMKSVRLPFFLRDKLFVKGHSDLFTLGAIITWWTWTSIVCNDVGAYFIGKKFGKNKLSDISSAAGAASPNKTIQGALGGFASCMLFSTIGAYLMSWPYWPLTGASYGLFISFLALVGDLMASMLKRDAKMKDSGNILPGHGGLLDRIDSYMFTAPASFFFFTAILPYAKSILKTKIAL